MSARLAGAVALFTLTACSSLMDSDTARVQGTLTFVNGAASALAPVPPYLTVLDSVDLRVTSATGTPIVTMGRRLARHELQATMPLELPAGSATFSAQVLSTNDSVLFSGTVSAEVSADGFQVTLPLTARRPALVVAADTSRTNGPATTQFQIYNGGSSTLAWTIPTVDPVFVTCTPCSLTPRSGSLAAQQSATVTLSVPIDFASRNMSFVVHSAEGDVTPVWSYTIATIGSIAISPSPGLTSVQVSTPFTATVQSTGSTAVNWSSLNPGIATITSGGTATGVASGTATIVATSAVDRSVSASALLRVYLPPLTSSGSTWSIIAPATPDTVSRDGPGGTLTETINARISVSSGFQNPFTIAEFWARASGSTGPWRRIGQDAAPGILDNGQTRSYTFTTTWNPSVTDAPFSNGVTRLDLIATGVTPSGTISATFLNQQLWIRIP